eukprot:SAG31_NODE_476_length_15154_cov_24.796878_16_plen_233_part_00
MKGERNFHVFYHVFQPSALDSSAWGLSPEMMKDFHYLNQSGTYGAEMVDDKGGENGIDAVIAAFKGLLPSDEDPDRFIQDIYTIIAGILWLGNITFDGDEAKVVDPKPLEMCAKCFGCSAADLAHALTHATKKLGMEQVATVLSVADATINRDSLAKNMYLRCFDDCKDTAKRVLSSGEDARIGVLDIFGFESFEKNTFEQCVAPQMSCLVDQILHCTLLIPKRRKQASSQS